MASSSQKFKGACTGRSLGDLGFQPCDGPGPWLPRPASRGRMSQLHRLTFEYTLQMRSSVPVELEHALSEYRRLLEEEFGRRLRAVRLFGSRARGDADDESDADVSVVVEGLTDDERGRVIDLAFRAWQHAGGRGPLIAPLPWSDAELEARRRAERRIALDIEREGVPL